MGSACEEFVALLYEALLGMRKNFGMYGQIGILIRDVTPERLTVAISTSDPLDGASLAMDVRNAVLNRLEDLLPIECFVAVYENPTLGIVGEVHELPYAADLPDAGLLESSEHLNASLAGPAREELRERFGQAWGRFTRETG